MYGVQLSSLHRTEYHPVTASRAKGLRESGSGLEKGDRKCFLAILLPIVLGVMLATVEGQVLASRILPTPFY